MLAGGLAGEKSRYDDVDKAASQNDQERITERGGGPIEQYEPKASAILKTNILAFDAIRKTLRLKWIVVASGSEFDSTGDSSVLLTFDELRNIFCKSKESER